MANVPAPTIAPWAGNTGVDPNSYTIAPNGNGKRGCGCGCADPPPATIALAGTAVQSGQPATTVATGSGGGSGAAPDMSEALAEAFDVSNQGVRLPWWFLGGLFVLWLVMRKAG